MPAPRVSSFFRCTLVATSLVALAGGILSASEGRQRDNDEQRFLAGWYDRADFYESKEAKLGRLKITPESELELGRNVNFAVTASTDSEAQRYLQDLSSHLIQGGPPAVSHFRERDQEAAAGRGHARRDTVVHANAFDTRGDAARRRDATARVVIAASRGTARILITAREAAARFPSVVIEVICS